MQVRRHVIAGLLIMTLFGWAARDDIAFAQLDPSAPITPPGEEQLFLLEIPSVYSASKYDQKVTEAPASVSIVTEAEIKKYGYRTLADILRSIRGFHVSYDRNYHSIGIRGFARPGDYNSRILLLVDGHRINDSIYDSATIGTESPVDIDTINRVEIIRGPSSSLYGSNAFFGVINIITKRGRDLQGPEVSGEYGSFNTSTGRLTYGNKFQSGLEMFLSGSFYTSDGQDRLFFEEFDDPETNHGVFENNDEDRAHTLFGKFSYDDFTLMGGHISREKRVPTASFESAFNDPQARSIDEHTYINLQYEHHFSTRWSVLGRLSYDHYYFKGDFPLEDEDDDTLIILNRDLAQSDSIGSEVQFTIRALPRHTLTAGGEFHYTFRLDQSNFDLDPAFSYLDDKRDTMRGAFYIQDEFELFSNLILQAGLRYDHFEVFGGSLNPRVAVIYNPLSSTTLKFLYGTAFRAPNAFERYYHDGKDTTKVNTELSPEKITTYELVLEQYFARYLRGTLNTFYYTIDDLITLVTDPADDLLVYRNANTVVAHGMELELEGKWPNGFEGRVSYSYQKVTDDKTHEVLTDSPRHLAKLNLVAPLFEESLFASLEVQYTSERHTLASNTTAAFAVTNLTLLSRDLWLNGLSLSVSVYNLFDERYRDPASEEHEQDVLKQNGRTFRLKLTYAF